MDRIVDEFDEIKAIERDLREGLRHVPAPHGFTDRVMARVAEREPPATKPLHWNVLSRMRSHDAWWAGIAASLLVAIGGGDALLVRHQRHAKQEAVVQAQLDTAMQLTSHALNEVQIGLDRSPAGKFSQLWNGTEK